MKSNRMYMPRRYVLMLLVAASMLAGACAANQNLLRKESGLASNSSTPKSQYEQDLDAIRTAGFTYIFVLRRRDGGKMTAEDRGFIKQQTVDTNRRVSTDDDRVFLIGSNNALPSQNVAALYDRFAIENYSTPPEQNTNSTANSNK